MPKQDFLPPIKSSMGCAVACFCHLYSVFKSFCFNLKTFTKGHVSSQHAAAVAVADANVLHSFTGHILEGYVHSVKCVCVCVCVCVSDWFVFFFRLLFYFNTAKTKHNFITFAYSHNVLLIVYNNNIKITVHLQICQNRHCRPYDFSVRC